jgi:hypothetical protein
MIWGVGLALLITGLKGSISSVQTLLSHGLNSTATNTVDQTISMTTWFSITENILLANTPQIIISFAYLYYNNVLTCMLFAHEWSSMATIRQPLRVSRPRGEQRSTYYLQLPYLYILPLMAAMSCLHWLVARSIFLLSVKVFDNSGAEDPNREVNVCGYSPFAILMALCVGAILILILSGLSWLRKLHGGIPVVGSCSAAISAACHAPNLGTSKGDSNLEDNISVTDALLPLMYGVMSDGRDAEGRQWMKPHVGFSSAPVMPLVDGIHY